MTVPAYLAAKEKSGRPFILHIHALGLDGSGEHVNQEISEMERLGMAIIDKVSTMGSYFTGSK